ncbi:MAG: RHS repeat-associated core domain-containing protein, partial [Anaerolineae bacterium]|nr:RHS repeat-associated core domain-containing protein [Anaerolineae bacterium]
TPFAFTGQPRDLNGLQYHRARYYDPELGVWLSEDPLELGNRYAYVDGNPVNRVDGSGLIAHLPVSCGGFIDNQDHTASTCVSSPAGNNGQVKPGFIGKPAEALWLTVACNDSRQNTDWIPYVDEINQAIRLVSSAIGYAGVTFQQVFGQLEFRLNTTTDDADEYAAEVQNGRWVQWYFNSTCPASCGISSDPYLTETIIHELGHVLDNRVNREMTTLAGSLRRNVLADGPQFNRNYSSNPEEVMADHFLNWVLSAQAEGFTDVIRLFLNDARAGVSQAQLQQALDQEVEGDNSKITIAYWLGLQANLSSNVVREGFPGITDWLTR